MTDDIVQAWIGDRQGAPIPVRQPEPAPKGVSPTPRDPLMEVMLALGDYLPARAVEYIWEASRTGSPGAVAQAVSLLGAWRDGLEKKESGER